MPQGFILDPLLFSIYLSDLLYLAESNNVCNLADDTTFYACVNTTFYACVKDLNSLFSYQQTRT